MAVRRAARAAAGAGRRARASTTSSTPRGPGPDGSRATRPTCTLREAVQSPARRRDSITVPAGTYVLTPRRAGARSATRINGAGARSTIIDGNATSRVSSRYQRRGSSRLDGDRRDDPRRQRRERPTSRTESAAASTSRAASLQLNNSHVVGNTATDHGGGIAHRRRRSSLTMIGIDRGGNTVTGRLGRRGGGIGGHRRERRDRPASTRPCQRQHARQPTIGTSAGRRHLHRGRPGSSCVNVTIAGNTARRRRWPGHARSRPTRNSSDDEQHAHRRQHGPTPATRRPRRRRRRITTSSRTARARSAAPLTSRASTRRSLALANNGGPTDTRALPAGSPAINAGGSVRRRPTSAAIARPPAACDIGAFEYVAPTLTVTTSVINDNGGTATVVHLSRHAERRGRRPAARRPANATYTLEPGTFNVSAGLTGYTVTIGGDCSPTGDVDARREPDEDLHDRRQRQRGARGRPAPAARHPRERQHDPGPRHDQGQATGRRSGSASSPTMARSCRSARPSTHSRVE